MVKGCKDGKNCDKTNGKLPTEVRSRKALDKSEDFRRRTPLEIEKAKRSGEICLKCERELNQGLRHGETLKCICGMEYMALDWEQVHKV